jgi:hypothetical protein
MLFCITALLICFLSFSQTNQHSGANQMGWLIGSWKGMHNGKPFYEAWRQADKNILVNFSIEINGADTTVKEETAIIINDTQTTFGKSPTQWKLKRLTPNEIMFENDTLKYSNRIIWLHTLDDHWFTILQNPKSTVYYDMIKMPELEAVVNRFIAGAQKQKK